jgi:omega-amidase
VEKWVRATAEVEHTDIIILPEMWTTAYTLLELERYTDKEGEPTTKFLQGLAKKFKINIIGGSFANMKSG